VDCSSGFDSASGAKEDAEKLGFFPNHHKNVILSGAQDDDFVGVLTKGVPQGLKPNSRSPPLRPD
jgi:hypothetical protein